MHFPVGLKINDILKINFCELGKSCSQGHFAIHAVLLDFFSTKNVNIKMSLPWYLELVYDISCVLIANSKAVQYCTTCTVNL